MASVALNLVDIENFSKKTGRVSEAAYLLKAMASETRLTILCALSSGEMSVTALAELTGQTASSISQHLSKLRSVGLVENRRDAQTIYYRTSSGVGDQIVQLLCEHYAS